jgi:hypothetical protein
VSAHGDGRRIRLGLVSGDGLPVSGLLTIFKNVVELGTRHGIVDGRIAADLGYSWRPDKEGFFPAGNAGTEYPPWLSVTSWHPARARQDPAAWAQALTRIRRAAAAGEDDDALARAAGEIEAEYHGHFLTWMAEHGIDWVVAVNMTLTDAVPVSRALASAAAQRFSGRPGGVLYWDHDLLGSCGIIDPGTGRRYYPAAPNQWTPVPAGQRHNRWAVISPGLREEAEGYPTALEPRLVPNILPREPDARLGERHHSFARHWGLDLRAPVLLSPVRVFSVKGVEITLALAAQMARLLQARGERQPQLLAFGSLREEPAYARRVVKARSRHRRPGAVPRRRSAGQPPRGRRRVAPGRGRPAGPRVGHRRRRAVHAERPGRGNHRPRARPRGTGGPSLRRDAVQGLRRLLPGRAQRCARAP